MRSWNDQRAVGVKPFPQEGSDTDPSPMQNEAWEKTLAGHFKLTRAELRFAQAFYQAASVKAAAESLRVGYGTGRQHMHSIARKTGASGQVGIMKGLCSLALTGEWST